MQCRLDTFDLAGWFAKLPLPTGFIDGPFVSLRRSLRVHTIGRFIFSRSIDKTGTAGRGEHFHVPFRQIFVAGSCLLQFKRILLPLLLTKHHSLKRLFVPQPPFFPLFCGTRFPLRLSIILQPVWRERIFCGYAEAKSNVNTRGSFEVVTRESLKKAPNWRWSKSWSGIQISNFEPLFLAPLVQNDGVNMEHCLIFVYYVWLSNFQNKSIESKLTGWAVEYILLKKCKFNPPDWKFFNVKTCTLNLRCNCF